MMNGYQDKDASYYTHTRPEILPFVPGPISTALDVGCGTGSFGQSIKQLFNCEVWGIEPNQKAAAEAAVKIDKAVNSFFFDDMPELRGKVFDVIFFNDVLEHLAEPEEALQACKKLLSHKGVIIASIPNMRWYPVILSLLRYKDFKYERAGVMDKTHLRFFTLKSMRRMFEEAGYQVAKSAGINEDKDHFYFNILNFLLFNSQWDMKFKQFVIVAGLP